MIDKDSNSPGNKPVTMPSEFIESVSAFLQTKNYTVQQDPALQNVHGLLYAFTPETVKLGFGRVHDHFLFVDWDNTLFGRQDILISIYKDFSKFVNQKYSVLHGFRMTFPNLAMVAITTSGFPEETIAFIQQTFFVPWYGGETGQMMLVDLEKRRLYYHTPPRFRSTGSLPIGHSLDVLRPACLSGLG
jgi:hypothetical protein